MSLIAWYPLNGDLNDKIRNNNLIYTNNNSKLVSTTGLLGGCYERVAANNGADVLRSKNKLPALDGDLSMCCWAFVTATPGDSANGLISNHSHENNSGFGITVKQISSTDYRISCSTGKGDDRTYHRYYGTSNIKDAWHHLCLTYSASRGSFTLWVDGVAEKTQAYTNYAISDYLDIFGWSTTHYTNNAYRPAAKLCDVRVYDHELSKEEIRILSQGLVFHYSFNDPCLEYTTNIIGDNAISTSKLTMNFTAVVNDGKTTITTTTPNSGTTGQIRWHFPLSILTSGTTYYFSCKYRILSGAGSITFTDWCDVSLSDLQTTQYDDYYYVSMKCTPRASGYDSTYSFLDMSIAQESVVEFWDMQLQTNSKATPYAKYSRLATCTDESGNGHHANQTNMTYSTDTALGSQAAIFNGSTSCLEVPFVRSDLFNTPYTLSFWVYPDDDGRAIYFGDHQLSGGVSMNFERKSGGAFRYYHGGSPDTELSNTKAPTGQWTMITLTSDGTYLKGYVNGELTDTKTFTPTITKSAGIMRIGRDNRSDSTALAGKMADFRWYATALSAEDIKILYSSAGAVDNQQNLWYNEIVESDDFEYVDTTEKHQLAINTLIENHAVLPSGFTPLAYIQSTGTQYLDLDYTLTSNNFEIELTSQWTGTSTGTFASYFGFMKSSSTTAPRIGIHNYSSTFMYGIDATVNTIAVDKDKHTFTLTGNNKTSQTFKIRTGNNVQSYSAGGYDMSTNTLSMYLFCRNVANVKNNLIPAKIFDFKITADGVVIRHMIPCKRNSDSAIGMYDVINKKMYTNAGTGTFTAGPAANLVGIFDNGLIEANKFYET